MAARPQVNEVSMRTVKLDSDLSGQPHGFFEANGGPRCAREFGKGYVEYSALIRTYSAVRSQERNSSDVLPAPSAMRISYTGSDI
jgi:hypothetical protein